jgi:hypothetical protein
VLIFEPAPGREAEMDRVLRSAKARAAESGWHCWAYRNEIAANEITLFLEGPQEPDGSTRPIFGSEIEELRALSARFERVRSLAEYTIEEHTA